MSNPVLGDMPVNNEPQLSQHLWQCQQKRVIKVDFQDSCIGLPLTFDFWFSVDSKTEEPSQIPSENLRESLKKELEFYFSRSETSTQITFFFFLYTVEFENWTYFPSQ